MTSYLGFDCYDLPSDDVLTWLKSVCGATWCGFYLGPAPSHQDDGWMGQRQRLIDLGLGLAPIYVGQELAGPGSHDVTEAQGTTDGKQAAQLMKKAGFPTGAVVYLDLEDGAPFEPPRSDYVKAWAAAVSAARYQPGAYCSHDIVETVRPVVGGPIWAFRVRTTAEHLVSWPQPVLEPAGCGTAVDVWQYEQNVVLRTTLPEHVVVDLSWAVTPDPSTT